MSNSTIMRNIINRSMPSNVARQVLPAMDYALSQVKWRGMNRAAYENPQITRGRLDKGLGLNNV